MTLTEDILERIATTLEEQMRLTKLTNWTKVKEALEQNLPAEVRYVYELSDGSRSLRDIEKLTGVSRTKVGGLWKKWHLLGLLEKSGKFDGRMINCFSLEDYEIEIPRPKAKKQVGQQVQEGEKIE